MKGLIEEAEYYQSEDTKNILAFKSNSVEKEDDCKAEIIEIVANVIRNKEVIMNVLDESKGIQRKVSIFHKCVKGKRISFNYTNLQIGKAELAAAINYFKSKYFKRLADKRNDPTKSSKTYRSVTKVLFMGKEFILFFFIGQ